MKTLGLIFPNQLFEQHPILAETLDKVLLVEDSLFFGDDQYPCTFHKQKLAYHRTTLKHYENYLKTKGISVQYIPYKKEKNVLLDALKKNKFRSETALITLDPVDYTLQKRLTHYSKALSYKLILKNNPSFINTQQDNESWQESKKRWLMSDFYPNQRKRLNILVKNAKPIGGKWSFDADNRKKIPKQEINLIPKLPMLRNTELNISCVQSIHRQFKNHPGTLEKVIYPSTFVQAKRWLDHFLQNRLAKFGAYEDAILGEQNWLYHSVLTPMLNTGLLTPKYVIDKTLLYANEYKIPLNSLEGFIRQIIGWREFMRLTYIELGVKMRNQNHWRHTRSMPSAFYTATTDVEPVDITIRKILETGYCHHIERLMVLGGFMFLCEIHPNEIYEWFMELFIDSYDWVMVPNVYAMSQHADGGLITTKPYFSGSNYILKMSHFEKGPWCEVWDALFWRWILKNKKKLQSNPRWSMICRQAEKMECTKQKQHIRTAENYLASLI